MKKLLICLASVSTLFLASCALLRSTAALATCEFNVKSLSNPTIGGLGIGHVTNIDNLDVGSLARLSLGILAKDLPLTSTVNLGVTNPNSNSADLAGLDWVLLYNGKNMMEGFTHSPIHVPANGGNVEVPVVVKVNLFDLFGKETKDEGFKFANGLLNLGDSNSNVALKVRPSFYLNGKVVKAGYVTVHKNIRF